MDLSSDRSSDRSGDRPGAWQFRQTDGTQPAAWHSAIVPGDVHLDLLADKLIPDPFYRDNESKLQWIQRAGWEYRRTIDVSEAALAHSHVELVFEGLDGYAVVSVNGHPVLTADNMFREWRVDVKTWLRAGGNELLVVFQSPDHASSKLAAEDPLRQTTPALDRTYLRKAAYEYGWDWGPTFVTSGIWKSAHLLFWDEARISNVYIHQREITQPLARVDADITVLASQAATATLSLAYGFGDEQSEVHRQVMLAPGENHIVLPIEIRNPHLWYPAGYGEQPIYAWKAQLATAGKVLDQQLQHAGLRSVVLRRDKDQWGRSFEFVVNGIPIFAKGADVIPFDSFPSRVTTAQLRRILQSARDSNMNMVRVWGGGYYQSEEFYELCDALGLMVWQDFMFGNKWQPGAYSFRENVREEAVQQVERLRNHPSIVLWCGNNETEQLSWSRVADEVKAKGADDVKRTWQDYLLVFSGILPEVVAALNPDTPYWPSSPSADYEVLPPDQASGDVHDWDVWARHYPFTRYEEHTPRFMSEYGFQAFPEKRTIEQFTAPEDRKDYTTPVMRAHQKNGEGNALIHEYLLRDYDEPKDFSSFLYVSQVLQAEGVKVGAEHLRRSRPRTMGSLFWQLNDCWPVASWSSIDYYGRWKALEYYARRFYAPVLVSPHLEEGTLAVYVVSDKTQTASMTLRLRIMTLQGAVVREISKHIEVPALSSNIYIQEQLSDLLPVAVDRSDVFVTADVSNNGKALSSNLLYLVPTKQMHLPPSPIHTDLRPMGDHYELTLTSPALARSLHVSFGDLDVAPSDDFFDLLPNTPAHITISSKEPLDRLKEKLKVISLADAFTPAGSGS